MVTIPPKPWPTGLAEQLEPLVRRVLAPNPSPYTYTGTQTYIVGSGADVAVIDPGPDDEAHIAAIIAAAHPAKISAIVCTHTHRDHSPAAAPLAAKTGAPIIGCAPLIITSDIPKMEEAFDQDYAPQRVLLDGETLSGDGWSLTAISTPGHTSNHLCYALNESGAVFTGDHVMGWSTSVVIPPDGNMGDYIASLEKLYARDDRVFHSAHGPAIENPKQLLRSTIGHRRQRERQILKLITAAPQTATDLVTAMYKALNPKLIGAAELTVTAHLLDLENREKASCDDGVWRAEIAENQE